MSYIEVNPIIDSRMMSLCKTPYHNHPKGCPNFNKKDICPPRTKLFGNYKKVFAIYNVFNLKSHVDRMRSLHPDWTYRQLSCCLYWQPKARKQLREKVKNFLRENDGYKIINNPEAMGVNITETMKNAGIILEWPPMKNTYQIVFALSV